MLLFSCFLIRSSTDTLGNSGLSRKICASLMGAVKRVPLAAKHRLAFIGRLRSAFLSLRA